MKILNKKFKNAKCLNLWSRNSPYMNPVEGLLSILNDFIFVLPIPIIIENISVRLYEVLISHPI